MEHITQILPDDLPAVLEGAQRDRTAGQHQVFPESQVIAETIERFATVGIMVLPLHDALVVQASAAGGSEAGDRGGVRGAAWGGDYGSSAGLHGSWHVSVMNLEVVFQKDIQPCIGLYIAGTRNNPASSKIEQRTSCAPSCLHQPDWLHSRQRCGPHGPSGPVHDRLHVRPGYPSSPSIAGRLVHRGPGPGRERGGPPGSRHDRQGCWSTCWQLPALAGISGAVPGHP